MALLKWLAAALATLSILPVLLAYRVQIALFRGREELVFQGYSQRVSLYRGILGMYRRRAFYQQTLWRCAPDCSIGFGTLFATPEVEIGRGVYIGAYCNLGQVTLGDDVLLGSNVHILGGKRQHSFERIDAPIRAQGGKFDRVTIGPDVWIGNNSVVMADVAEHSVIAAASVVPKPVAPWSIMAGNPARLIDTRNQTLATVDVEADAVAMPAPPAS